MRNPGALRFILVASALVLGGVAELLIGGGNLRWAVAPYLTAIAAIALAVVNRPLSSFAPELATAGRPLRFDQRSLLTSHGRGATALEGTGPERLMGLGTFVLSIIMLVASLYWFANGPPNTLAWYSYGVSVALLLVALPSLDGGWTRLARRLRERHRVSFELRSILPWAALGVVLILALAVRLYDLQELPAGLWYDEADNLAEARVIQLDPGSTPVFVPSTNLPSLFLMPIAVLIELTGITLTTGRLVAVAFGLGGVVAVFLLVRLMLGPYLGLVAAFLTAVMRWDINWSRIGMHGITTPMFAALTAYLTLRAVRSGRRSDFGYAGASLGLGLWFYSPFRLFPLVLGIILVHYLLFQRPGIKRFIGHATVMAVVGLFLVAPVLQSALTDPDEFFERPRAVSVFSHFSFGDGVKEVWKSLSKHIRMFSYEGDPNPRHNLPDAPMLDFVSRILLVLGLGVILGKWRDGALLSLPFWIFIMLLPGVLTLPWEAPQSLRSIGVTPAVVVLVALTVGVIWWVGRTSPWPNVRRATPIFLSGLLGMVAFANINTYFGEQARHPEVFASFSTDETLMARDMVRQQRLGYSLLVSRQFKYGLTTSLLARDPRYEVIRAPTEIPIDPAQVWLGAAIYLEPREASVFRLLRTYYPGGRFQEVRPPGGGDVLFYSAVISREQIELPHGLRAKYTDQNGTVQEAIQVTTEGVWVLDTQPEEVPFDLLWEGAVHVIEPGEYVLALEGDVSAEVLLDGRRILWDGQTSVRVEPAVGLHFIEVSAGIDDGTGTLRLLWQPPGGRLGPISSTNLYHGSVRPVGLAGRFFKSDLELELPDAMRVTPAMDTFYYDPVVPEPYIATWVGTLRVPQSGHYRFELGGAGTVTLFLDGVLVAQNPPTDTHSSDASLELDAGPHRIMVGYLSPSPPSQFEVLWKPPGAKLEPIPIELLSPDPVHMFRIASIGE